MSRPRSRRRSSTAVVERDERAVLRERLDQELSNIEILQESYADLVAQLNEPGWLALSSQFEREFDAEGLKRIRAACRLYAVKNPLIKRAINLRTAYVWAQGCEITARANGKQDGEQDVQAVIAKFLSDVGNQRAFTGPAARERLERCLGTDGEFFAACFSKPTTGEMQVRVVEA